MKVELQREIESFYTTYPNGHITIYYNKLNPVELSITKKMMDENPNKIVYQDYGLLISHTNGLTRKTNKHTYIPYTQILSIHYNGGAK